jgi:hypothetical protein
MNLFQSLLSAGTKSESPLHVGEVMSLWAIMLAFQEGRVMILGFLNHTRDPELKRYMEQWSACAMTWERCCWSSRHPATGRPWCSGR